MVAFKHNPSQTRRSSYSKIRKLLYTMVFVVSHILLDIVRIIFIIPLVLIIIILHRPFFSV